MTSNIFIRLPKFTLKSLSRAFLKTIKLGCNWIKNSDIPCWPSGSGMYFKCLEEGLEPY